MKRGQGSFSQQVNRAVPGDMSASKALCALTDQKMALACSSCRSLFYSSSRSICDFRSHETHCIKNAGAFTRSLTALCRTDIIERHMSGNTGAQEFCLAVCQLSLTRAPRRFSRVRPESPSRYRAHDEDEFQFTRISHDENHEYCVRKNKESIFGRNG